MLHSHSADISINVINAIKSNATWRPKREISADLSRFFIHVVVDVSNRYFKAIRRLKLDC